MGKLTEKGREKYFWFIKLLLVVFQTLRTSRHQRSFPNASQLCHHFSAASVVKYMGNTRIKGPPAGTAVCYLHLTLGHIWQTWCIKSPQQLVVDLYESCWPWLQLVQLSQWCQKRKRFALFSKCGPSLVLDCCFMLVTLVLLSNLFFDFKIFYFIIYLYEFFFFRKR